MTNYERILAFPLRNRRFYQDSCFRKWGYDPHWVQNVLLGFCTAAATEAKDLDQRLRQIKAVRQMPG